MDCPRCGNPLTPLDRECPSCGAKLLPPPGGSMVTLRDRSRTWPVYLGVAALAVALGFIWWAVKPFTGTDKTVTADGGAPVTTIALTPATGPQPTRPAQTVPPKTAPATA